jgi:putative transposase
MMPQVALAAPQVTRPLRRWPVRSADGRIVDAMSPIKGKLHHTLPGWVPAGSRFHVRLRLEKHARLGMTAPALAPQLLDSAAFYHVQGRWYVWLILLMPDHAHMIASFPPDKAMSRVIGDWKRYQTRMRGLVWQENYFDHRLRSDEEFLEKAHYIRMNPVRAGLCRTPEEWVWIREPWKDAQGNVCRQE